MPFGEDLGAGVGPRTENLKYSAFGSDRVRQRFTGYEKDDETGLDFAEARYYYNNHGRFTAPAPLLASASAANPQTFNRYIYTGNNPVNITDPSGLNWCRNKQSGVTEFTGQGVPCESGWDKIDEQQWTLVGDWSNYGGRDGERAIFIPDGTISIVIELTQEQLAYGDSVAVQVEAEQQEILTTGAATLSYGANSSDGIIQLPTAAAPTDDFHINGSRATGGAGSEQTNIAINLLKSPDQRIGFALLALQMTEKLLRQDILSDGITLEGSFAGFQAGITYTRDGHIFGGWDSGRLFGTGPLEAMEASLQRRGFSSLVGVSVVSTKILSKGNLRPDERDSTFDGSALKVDGVAGKFAYNLGQATNGKKFVAAGISTPGAGFGIGPSKNYNLSKIYGIKGPVYW